MSRRGLAVAALGAALGAALAAAPPPMRAAQAAGVVLAVDTSRSLRGQDVAQTTAALRRVLDTLPPETQVGVLAFDDEARWLASPGSSPGQARAALADLRPGGRYTLLHDALYAAGEALSGGGVVVLASDGRDENSATTLEDVARLYAARGIKLHALGAGRVRDERALRRLALLTGGSYAGDAARADAPRVAQDVARELARREAAAPRAAPAPSSVAPAAPPAPVVVPALAQAEETTSGWMIAAAAGALLAAALAVGAALFLRWRRGRPRSCPRCGAELPVGASECPRCAAAELESALRTVAAAGPEEAMSSFLDTGVVVPLTLEQRLEHTFVIQEQPVLVVHEAGEPPRSFLLPAEKAFAVGREPGQNTLAIPDPTLSAHHFRVVPRGEAFYLLDLSSTNGTFLRGERVRAAPLRPGDRLRAGQVEFDFDVEQRRLGGPQAPRQRARG